MDLNTLTAISPIDGRYRAKTEKLSEYFSEYALMKYRVRVEIEYFIALCEIPLPQLKFINPNIFSHLRNYYLNFSINDAKRIKDIEHQTNHDVKAVEYFIKEQFSKLSEILMNGEVNGTSMDTDLSPALEFIHFGLTSQDINNTAIPLALKDAMEKEFLSVLNTLTEKLKQLSRDTIKQPMLAHTHGQPASPTTVGKEIFVFVERLEEQLKQLKTIPWSAKFGGATGNFNAHYATYPKIDWVKFADEFVNEKLGLHRSKTTTQIEHYDNLAALCDNLRRINIILVDFTRDMWTYISVNYFKQKIKKEEVGSSAMPHKVNPIDFENAEGNLLYANSIYDFLSNKLPVSRLQRDLTDSTVIRNAGIPIAHSLIAFQSLTKGLEKVTVNPSAMENDLRNNWAVLAEAIQTILRREGFPKPYEALKELTRKNSHVTKDVLHSFIDGLNVSASVKNELRNLTPENYIGNADRISF